MLYHACALKPCGFCARQIANEQFGQRQARALYDCTGFAKAVSLNVHRLIIRFNKWDGAFPDCPFIQLTTLDENKDAKQVSTEE